MIRILYRCLLHLHPPSFRGRFAEEMTAIFDEAPSIRFLGDALLSLIRQWLLRPQHPPVPARSPDPAGMFQTAMFQTLDDYKPRRFALAQGALLSAMLFGCLVFAAANGAQPIRYLIGSPDPRAGALSVTPNSIAPSAPDAVVKVPQPAIDPWLNFASHYFKIIYVLNALDANHDYVISASEIAAAPTVLRSLDLDGDGKLTAEEAGMCLGAGSFPGCRGENTAGDEHGRIDWSPSQMTRFRAVFMGTNPVLAALDADGDGEISALEIRNAAASLRRLDLNGDGRLLPVEIASDSVASKILMSGSLLPQRPHK